MKDPKVRNQILTSFFKFATALVVALAIPAATHATLVSMTANDPNPGSSYNNAGNWNDASAPSAGKDYTTVGYLMRSPVVGGVYQSGLWTFAGDSLTVGGGNGGGANPFDHRTANNNALIFKANGLTLNVANLILDGGQIRDGDTDGNMGTVTGNIFVTANGGAFMNQQSNIIASVISGSGPIWIGDNGNANGTRVTIFTSGLSTYNGSITLTNANNDGFRSRLTFAVGSVMNFTPLASGVNNSITGTGNLMLDGGFNIDLNGASNGLSDSWQLVGTSNGVFRVFYDPTFSVNGFAQSGTLWDKDANGVTYQFDQLTGLLSVIPEPSTIALVGFSLLGLLAHRRSRKA